jgi:hypothetical protein
MDKKRHYKIAGSGSDLEEPHRSNICKMVMQQSVKTRSNSYF